VVIGMNREPVRLLLVGVGGYGLSYVAALLGRGGGDGRKDAGEGWQVVGVVDPVMLANGELPPELHAREIPVFHDLPDACAAVGPVHLSIISTPIHLHARQTLAALAEGSSVLCEKPLAATVEDGVRVAVESERVAGQFVAVGYQWSFSRPVQALKRDVMAGVFGKPIRLRTIVTFPRGERYFRRNSWAGRLKTDGGELVFDGPMNNATAHYLHNMLYVLGPTRETSAAPVWVEAELYRANDIESHDTAALRCRTDGGAELLFYTTHAALHRMGPVCRFEFERGTVEYTRADGGFFTARLADGSVRNYGRPEMERDQKLWQSIDAVRSGEPVACGPRAALPHALCVAAAQASSPIREFPESLKRRSPMDELVGGGEIVWVEGLPEVLAHCWERGVLPGELGLDWATTGRRINASLPAEKINAVS
jgi:predicted dehydrogenase